jgi:hypothetical protein
MYINDTLKICTKNLVDLRRPALGAISARAYACIRVAGGDVPNLVEVPLLDQARHVPLLDEARLLPSEARLDEARLLPLPVCMHMHVRL